MYFIEIVKEREWEEAVVRLGGAWLGGFKIDILYGLTVGYREGKAENEIPLLKGMLLNSLVVEK